MDYPFAANRQGREFLNALPLSPADKAKVAGENAAALLRLLQQVAQQAHRR